MDPQGQADFGRLEMRGMKSLFPHKAASETSISSMNWDAFPADIMKVQVWDHGIICVGGALTEILEFKHESKPTTHPCTPMSRPQVF